MDRLPERIKTLRLKRGYTQRSLANELGIHQTAVSQWENGRTAPDAAMLLQLNELFDGELTASRPGRIPVLGSIPAGIPLEAVEDIEDWEELPEEAFRGGKTYFALRVKGESMMPEYRSGDTLILLKQEDCESGDDCAVIVGGSDATFKRVRITERGVTLQPLNPAFDPLFFTNEEVEELPVRVIGVVEEVRRRVKR